MTSGSPVHTRVDHLVYACPDLDDGIAAIRDLTGLDAIPGGSHPQFGTRNALVGLGDRCYLEIIGPDTNDTSTLPTIFTIDRIDTPRLVTWAMPRSDLERAAASVADVGVDLGGISDGVRTRPDGVTLAWRLTDPYAARLDGVVPFLIDWGDSEHPATTLSSRAKLTGIEFGHPDPEAAERALGTLAGGPVPVARADAPSVTAMIEIDGTSIVLR